MRSHRGKRGSIMIGTYLLLSIFLVYSNMLNLGTMTQQLAEDRLRQRLQAMDLAQGAIEQVRVQFFDFLKTEVNVLANYNDATKSLQWLDAMGQAIETGTPPPTPLFILKDRDGDGLITQGDEVNGYVDGVSQNPIPLSGLPTIDASQAAADLPRAWIAGIRKRDDPANPGQPDPDPLSPRLLTIEGVARVGSTTKRLRATYTIALGMSDIFRYAYFINNYGWLDTTGDPHDQITINGEVRSNGNLDLKGRFSVTGDRYASANPDLGMTGEINSTKGNWSPYWYWLWHNSQMRPARNPTANGQPPIGGTETILAPGYGWDNTTATRWNDVPVPGTFEHQPIQPMPYLGDLTFYKSLAIQRGGSLAYNDPGVDGKYDPWGDATPDDVRAPVIAGVYTGPDGIAGSPDDANPLVLVGSESQPIVINGPVVIPGDVLIRGVITGKGTIYAGRNIHFVNGLVYKNKPSWPVLERDLVTGRLRERCKADSWDPASNLGTVCNNGDFYPKGASLPAGCMKK